MRAHREAAREGRDYVAVPLYEAGSFTDVDEIAAYNRPPASNRLTEGALKSGGTGDGRGTRRRRRKRHGFGESQNERWSFCGLGTYL